MSSPCPFIIRSNRVASFNCPFTGNVCCTLTDTLNDLRCLQVLWQLCVSPSPLFNNHSMTSYIPSLKLSSLCHAGFISHCSASLSCKCHCTVVNNQGFTHFVTIPTCQELPTPPLVWLSGAGDVVHLSDSLVLVMSYTFVTLASVRYGINCPKQT